MAEKRDIDRREALARLGVGVAGLTLAGCGAGTATVTTPNKPVASAMQRPVVISTWPFGVKANDAAWKLLSGGAAPLDAAVGGVQVVELDPTVMSVGRGGRPNAAGVVQLDACVMDGATAGIGAVAGLEGIATAAAVAQRVMLKTPHVLLVGSGARQFALQQGFAEVDLLTDKARQQWQAWKASQTAGGTVHLDDLHDTIGLLVAARNGDLAGACTTSGLAWKLPGRVGDSPLIGHGLYVDNDVGAAAATGVGEEVIRIVGSHTVVEAMRAGRTPQQAVELACQRVIDTNRKRRGKREVPADGFIAVNKAGVVAACAVHANWLKYAVTRDGKTELRTAPGLLAAQ